MLTKSEFIDAVAAKSGLSKKDASAAVDAVLDAVKDALRRGDDVTLTGFGKFSVQSRKARTGINPRNPSQKVTIPAERVPKFSAGSQLKAMVSAGERGALAVCRHGLPSVTGGCEH